MWAYDTPSEKCPYCGAECEADWVDVGIGMVQCGPYHCWECGASEIGPELQDWYDMKDGKIVMKDGHPFSELELDKGWYEPNKKTVSPYANTVGGVLVDHQTAKMMYDIGLIEIKIPSISDLCPHCFGSGKLKAMQMAVTHSGDSVRVEDMKEKCNHCNGTGRKK